MAASWHQAHGDLYKCIDAIHTKYGPTVRIAPDELSFTNPEAWPQIYNTRPQMQKTEFHFGRTDKQKLPESMVTATDAEHTRLRRLTNPAFLNAGILEVEPTMQHYVDLLCTQLHETCKEGSQNMVQWFLWTLNDVIGHLALDQEFECLKKRRMHPWPNFLLVGLKLIVIFNQFRRFGITEEMLSPLLTKRQLEERENFLNEGISAVNQRLAREKAEKTGDEESLMKRPDILGLMLREMKDGNRLTEQEVTANSILIVSAGADTTSACLSGTFCHLLKTPKALKKLKDEIRGTFASAEEITIRATSNLPYLKATVDESLRIFPIASYFAPRITPTGGQMIAGELIPAGVSLSLLPQWTLLTTTSCLDLCKHGAMAYGSVSPFLQRSNGVQTGEMAGRAWRKGTSWFTVGRHT